MSDQPDFKFSPVPQRDSVQFRPSDHLKGYPPKKRGRHRFIVVVSYNVTHESLKRATSGGEAQLDMENIADMSAGCIDCEAEWPPKTHFCRAAAFEEGETDDR